MKRPVLAATLACLLAGCARSSRSPRLPTEAQWTAARQTLGELRATEPKEPFGAVVRVALREPHTGRTFSARGAVAVDPHRALRMVLIGPGGATALDVWATPEHWRFEVPAAGLLRRGGREDDPGLPTAFFRWWFLGPLDGRLLASFAQPSVHGERYILRHETGTVDLVDEPGPSSLYAHDVIAVRRDRGTQDRVTFRGRGLGLCPGDHATYDEEASGVHVDVTVESASDAPDPAAFVDPDVAGT